MSKSAFTRIAIIIWILLLPALLRAQESELNFEDFNSQDIFNSFSGDSGTFSGGQGRITRAYDTTVFHGRTGASLRIDYQVPSGFCGTWNSLVGKDAYPEYTWNFTNLFSPLKNSHGNPVRVENIHVLKFSFWAKGNGVSNFTHQVKVELKSPKAVEADAVFSIPNVGDWAHYELTLSGLTNADLSQMKELVFVVEDWRNDHRSSHFYLDDLTFTTDQTPADPAAWTDDALLDIVAQRAFFYFLKFTDDLGFALDRSTFSDTISVGAIGFQLASYCIGDHRGWADHQELENRVVKILRNLAKLPMGPDPGATCAGYKGFYYHFLEANTGLRKGTHVEVSPYDTTLLMFGVLACRQYFSTNADVQALSQELIDRVEWDWLVDHNPGPNEHQFYLSWVPAPGPDGHFRGHVDGQTDEALMLDIMALGSKTHPVSFDIYQHRSRPVSSYPPGNPNRFMPSWTGSLFSYFFASCWLDFRNRGRDLDPSDPRDLWENDRRAVLANHQFCVDHAGSYATYGPDSWGLTACDSLAQPAPGVANEYLAFGALPTEENLRFGTPVTQLGTLATYGAAGAINFAPTESIAALRHFFGVPGVWHPVFGFADAFSLSPHYLDPATDTNGYRFIRAAESLNGPWINNMVMGVDVGPMLLAIENYRSGLIWKLTAANPIVSTGLSRIFGLPLPEHFAISVQSVPGATADDGAVKLHWLSVPGASHYDVYSSPDFSTWTLRHGGITGTSWTDNTPPDKSLFYYLKAVP